MADDAVVTIVPPAPGTSGVFTGKGEIRGWYETIVGEHGVTTLSDCQVDGETVTCVNTYAADSITAMGLDSLVAEWVAVVRDGKFQSYSWTITDESLAEHMAAMPPPDDAGDRRNGCPHLRRGRGTRWADGHRGSGPANVATATGGVVRASRSAQTWEPGV